MDRFENVATPLAAFAVKVPESVPAAGFVSMATVMAPVNVVTSVPDASSADTCTGAMVCPACVDAGCTVKRSWVAGGGGAAVTLNALLVVLVRPELVACSV